MILQRKAIRMKRTAFALTDLLVSLVTLVAVTAILVPSLGMMRGDSMTQVSIDNLRTLGIAHVMYAGDWDGRQVTWTRDDLSLFTPQSPTWMATAV